MQISANGTMLEVARHGDAAGVPMVLIRGLGSQMIQWPPRMIEILIGAGCHVITFDNRDSGLSQKFDDAPDYTLEHMAEDTIGLMDALGLERAHVLGMSMGGMILQLMALKAPHRVLSATVVMSSSRAPDLPEASAEVRAALTSSAPSPARDDVIAHELATSRLWHSPGWPFDVAKQADMIGRRWDRCYCPDGTARQFRAMERSTPELQGIDEIIVPMLVIHGRQDALLPIAHGRDIAQRVIGAQFVEIDGMGHDLEGDLPVIVARHVLDFIKLLAMAADLHRD